MSDEMGLPPEPPEPPEPTPKPPPEPDGELPNLLKPALMPVETMVFCLDHLAVHADTVDPYGSGDDMCEPKDHRPLYYRARKGDPNDRKTDIEPTMIAGGEALTTAEKGVLAGLVRVQIRKVERNKRGAARLFGDEYDPTQHEEKLELLEGAYRRLGGDPARITGRGGEQ
jgi:hypothetical protein